MSYITPMILEICYNSRLSYEESCDIFGQVTYKILNNLGNLRSDNKFFAYVRSVTRTEIALMKRRHNVENKLSHKVLKALYEIRPELPDEKHERSKRTEIIIEAIMRLPEKQAELLKGLFFDPDEPSYDELAKRLNIPASSIGPTRARGLIALHRILKQKKFKF